MNKLTEKRIIDLEKKVEYLEENYRHNLHVLEIHMSDFMIKMQKKYGVTLKEGYDMILSANNPFKLDL
jgi:hypothetical protein